MVHDLTQGFSTYNIMEGFYSYLLFKTCTKKYETFSNEVNLHILFNLILTKSNFTDYTMNKQYKLKREKKERRKTRRGIENKEKKNFSRNERQFSFSPLVAPLLN